MSLPPNYPPIQANVSTIGFRIAGLSMTVAEPEYADAVKQRKMLLLKQRDAAVAKDQVKKWLTDNVLVPAQGGVEGRLYRIQTAQQRFIQKFGDESWHFVPEEVYAEIDQLYKRKIKAVFGKSVGQSIAINVQRLDADEKTLFRQHVTAATQFFSKEIQSFYFHRVPILKEHLKIHFDEWLFAIARTPSDQQLFLRDSDDELAIYQSKLVRGNVIPDMRVWAEAWLAARPNLSAAQKDAVQTEIVALFANIDEAESTRRAQLIEFNENLGDIVLFTSDAAANEVSFSDAVANHITDIADSVLAKQSADEIDADSKGKIGVIVERLWGIFMAESVILPLQLQFDLLDAKIAKIQPTRQVALRIQRSAGDKSNVGLSVSMQSTGKNLPTEYQWQYEVWSWTDANDVVLVSRSNVTADTSFTYQAAAPTRPITFQIIAKSFSNMVQNGLFASNQAIVSIVGNCLRCKKSYDIAAPRVFGECVWRKHPVTSAFAETLKASGIVEAAGRLAVDFCHVEPHLDDSIVSDDGQPILATADLLRLGSMTHKALVLRYFSYEAVLQNISKRMNEPLLAFLKRSYANPDNLQLDGIVQHMDRLSFASKYNSARDVLLRAQTLQDVPVWATLHSLLRSKTGESIRNTVLKQSESRFLTDLYEKLCSFADLFTLYANTAEFAKPEMGRVVFFGRPGTSRLRLNREITAEARLHACKQLAAMTSREIVYSEAWDMASVGVSSTALVPDDRLTLFIDTVGLERLVERIRKANEETRFLDRAWLREDQVATASNGLVVLQQAYRDLEARDATIKAYTAPITVPDVDAAFLQTSQTAVDWRDVHSYETDQPSLASMATDPASAEASVTRGSERLRTGRDFAGMHRRILQLRDEYNNEKRIGTNELENAIKEYNVLAFFGPPIGRKRERS